MRVWVVGYGEPSEGVLYSVEGVFSSYAAAEIEVFRAAHERYHKSVELWEGEWTPEGQKAEIACFEITPFELDGEIE